MRKKTEWGDFLVKFITDTFLALSGCCRCLKYFGFALFLALSLFALLRPEGDWLTGWCPKLGFGHAFVLLFCYFPHLHNDKYNYTDYLPRYRSLAMIYSLEIDPFLPEFSY